jgi:hypothetical protein
MKKKPRTPETPDAPAREPERRTPKRHEEAPGRNPAPRRPSGDEPPDGPLDPEGEDPDGEEG